MTTTATVPGGTEAADPSHRGRHGPAIEIVVPVHNEQTTLESSIERLHAYLTGQFPFTFRITIADNASTDGTWPLARALACRLPGVNAVHLAEKGRGRALRSVWTASDATVLAYMDVDLSTDLAALLPLAAPLLSGHSDLAIGTRLSPGSRVVRGAKREIISRCYNLLLRGALAAGFSDAQCGFKAIRRDVAGELLPLVEDTGWFFDTELLVLAERTGLRIHEVPVDWVDDPDSRVDVVATALADLKGMARIGRALATGALPIGQLRRQFGRDRLGSDVPGVPAGLAGQLTRFAGVGAASTLAYLALYLLLRGSLGAFSANLVALLVTALGNTAANRRITFGLGGRRHRRRDHVEGLAVLGLGLALTSGALTALHATTADPSRAVELAVLVAANLAATLLRFLLFRAWVFHPRRRAAAAEPPQPAAPQPAPRDLHIPGESVMTITAPELHSPAAPPVAPAQPTRWHRFVRGREADPVWARPALLTLLAATALLHLWGLGASGWANSFYAAAVQAGAESWKAFFFGSSDAANSITVDKPPASLWVMALFARIFGVNAWSMLVPQALAGVAAVGLLYAAVRRWASPGAGLIAGAALALTPVATLMFRFNNPDALLTLLLVAGAYCAVRATERASTRWLLLAATCVGFGFLTKMLQAFLVVPAFALVYLVAAPTPLRRRLVQLLLAGFALLVSAGWWVAIVELWPASSRPYIGGSQHNSVLELIFGYNGFGRLTGNETGSVTPGGGNGIGGMWGETGWSRLFDAEMGGQIAWLIPAALIFLAALLWLTRRAPRTNRTRASLLLWGGWLLVTGLTFSYMQGIFHAYYNVALAPAIAALVGVGAAKLWRVRSRIWARATLAVAVVATVGWAYVLLGRSADWMPWLRQLVLVGGLIAAAALLVPPALVRRAAVVVGAAGLLLGLAGPAAYAPASTTHGGAIPSAGPATAGGFGPGGRRPGGLGGPPGQPQAGQAPGLPPGGMPGTQGGNQLPGGQQTNPFGQNNGGPDGGGNPGTGGLLGGSTPSDQLVAALNEDADDYTWVAAAIGSNSASGYQLATGDPVMAIGGFNGSDPSPTLAQFQQYVAEGKIHYFIGGGMGMSNGGSNNSSLISQWVQENFSATTIDGTTLYDLTTSGGGTGT